MFGRRLAADLRSDRQSFTVASVVLGSATTCNLRWRRWRNTAGLAQLLWTSGFRKSAARFLAPIERIQRDEIERVLIAHKKARSLRIRPVRPSCARELCEIIAVNQESLSPEQEMVEDLLAIVHTFSCRLYGMRKVKKQIKEDYPGSKEPKEILE
jgi:hypothetical protein